MGTYGIPCNGGNRVWIIVCRNGGGLRIWNFRGKRVSAMEVENPMVLDSHWRHLEREPKVIGECAGCHEEVYAHDDWFEFEVSGQELIAHQNAECCYQFVGGISRSMSAED